MEGEITVCFSAWVGPSTQVLVGRLTLSWIRNQAGLKVWGPPTAPQQPVFCKAGLRGAQLLLPMAIVD